MGRTESGLHELYLGFTHGRDDDGMARHHPIAGMRDASLGNMAPADSALHLHAQPADGRDHPRRPLPAASLAFTPRWPGGEATRCPVTSFPRRMEADC